MLHVAYVMVPLGFLSIGVGAAGLVGPAVSAHVLGIGAVAGMTLAVMMRATMGHTGRPLVAGPWLTCAFALICGATLVRVVGQNVVIGGLNGVDLSAVLWTLAFVAYLCRTGSWLLSPKIERKAASKS